MAQTVLSDDAREESNNQILAEPLISEQIYRISQSKRIFIITNKSGQLNQGDFISLLTGSKLLARALVAKNANDLAGIKILKIYSLRRWSLVREKMTIQILRGDDSLYLTDRSQKEDDSKLKIENEDDLYNETKLIEEDLLLDDKGKRLIKTDNILSASMGSIQAKETDNTKQYYAHWMGSWAYQILDNIWVEGLFGFTQMENFPSPGLNALLYNTTLRLKYTFSAPFYSFVKPYFGFQYRTAKSDEAGVPFTGAEPSQLAREVELVDSLQENNLIFGVTVLKRLVPGWFISVNLGTDILGAGLALEF